MNVVDPQGPVLYWFRADLRLQDNPAWAHACALRRPLVTVVFEPVLAPREAAWGISSLGSARRAWWAANVRALCQDLASAGVELCVLRGEATSVLASLCGRAGIDTVVCEEIAAPYEEAEVLSLRAARLDVVSIWQSSLFAAESLPFLVADLPGVFTRFRTGVERSHVPVRKPLPAPVPVRGHVLTDGEWKAAGVPQESIFPELFVLDARSAFQWQAFSVTNDSQRDRPIKAAAGSAGGHAYLHAYLDSDRVANYKATRNGLAGMAYSSKWSPWLGVGALSAPELLTALRAHEAQAGASDGSYWLWFELLWRDYFRWLHLQYGTRLYRSQGLQEQPSSPKAQRHSNVSFRLWTEGRTGCDLVDAGMRELACSGYLSNRLRQVVASFLIYELGCDWRAGAAWFESQLLDYDVYSNHGNWLYIAGFGTDPRGGRRFNMAKQTADHDPDGTYRALWGVAL